MVLSIVKNGNDRLRKKNMQLRQYTEHENAKSSESTHHFLSKIRLGTDSSLVLGVMHERNLVTRLGEIRLSQIYHRCLVCHSLKVVKHGTLWNKIDFFFSSLHVIDHDVKASKYLRARSVLRKFSDRWENKKPNEEKQICARFVIGGNFISKRMIEWHSRFKHAKWGILSSIYYLWVSMKYWLRR